MANYYTNFSFVIEDLTEEQRGWILRFMEKAKDVVHVAMQGDGSDIWVWDGDQEGNVEDAVEVLERFMLHFPEHPPIGFQWANTCSKPRVDAYGGGAVLVTKSETIWMNTANWLYEETKKSGSNCSLCQA